MGSNPASRATLKGLSFGKALFLFTPALLTRTIARMPFGNAPATSRALSAASMKTAAIGRRPSSIESTRQGT
ncbi:hypothetical protein [Burkholderia cenocepacia]|uniref:hypothetical protein n=1 Tax=Burkholderia cenocepacia TaxID=95486 RepID=UPI00192C9385|nr:hypothetical protein [Burkholderia cenocepacia]